MTLSRRGYYTLDARLKKRLPRIILSAVLMGALLLAGRWLLQGNYAEGAGFIAALWGLGVLVAGGIAGYFALAHLTGGMPLGELKSMLKR